MDKLATALTISPLTYLCKAFRAVGLRSFELEGIDILLRALEEPKSIDHHNSGVTVKRKGIITSKHRAVY
jgi:hypothetical protein